jgi:transposase
MSRLSKAENQAIKEEVHKLYSTGNYSQREIANMVNKAPSQIARWTKQIDHINKETIRKRRKFLFGG